MKSDCLYELGENTESHDARLLEWLIKNQQVNIQLNWSIIIAAVIIAVAIVLAAFISHPSGGARFRGIGNNRVLDSQTGEVKWANPKK